MRFGFENLFKKNNNKKQKKVAGENFWLVR